MSLITNDYQCSCGHQWEATTKRDCQVMACPKCGLSTKPLPPMPANRFHPTASKR